MLISAHAGYPRWLDGGADFIEIDLRRDANGVVVLSHDEIRPGDDLVTFAHVLQIAGGRVGLQLDLKEPGYELEVVMAALDKSTPDKVVVTTADHPSIQTVKRHFPQVRAGITRQHVERTDADFIALDQAYATEDALDFCQRFAITLWLWTVDDKKLLKRFIKDTRIECLITNRPDLALKLRTARS